MSDCFLSIVHNDYDPDELMVRARRKGDIEKIFPTVKVIRYTKSDYLYRAKVPREVVAKAISDQLRKIDYPNFKDSVENDLLHDLYTDVWLVMTAAQELPPYSGGK